MKHFLTIALITAAACGPALADEALARGKQCVACHAVDKKLVGPAYKDVAKRYALAACAAFSISCSPTTDPGWPGSPAWRCPG